MNYNIYKISFFFFLIILIQSCEKSELEDNTENNNPVTEEINYYSKFPESITFPENSTDAVLLKVSDDNGIETVTTSSADFEINNQNEDWYISPLNAFDFETTTGINIIIKVIDKLGNQEEKNIIINITDKDESDSQDTTDQSESVDFSLPVTIELYNTDGTLISTLSYEYDGQDRQTRFDYRMEASPEYNYYIITTYSGNTSTTKHYITQTNEPAGGYSITIYSSTEKPLKLEIYTEDGIRNFTYFYEYDGQDRQTRIDYRNEVNPEYNYYLITTYSGNTSTIRQYLTQTNEPEGGYSTTTYSSNGKTLKIESFSEDGVHNLTYSYEYDEQDRQTRIDYRNEVSPEYSSYTIITYSGNTSTTKQYFTQTNEPAGGYSVTTFKE